MRVDQSPGDGEGAALKLPVELRREAKLEFDEAFDWYDARA